MNSVKTILKTSKNIRKPTLAIAFFALGIFATIGIFTLKERVFFSPDKNLVGVPEDFNIYTIKRLKGFQNIQPVVTIGPQEESTKLQPLKNEIETLIDSLKAAGFATDISVYFKNHKRGHWISINDNVDYHPASLMKVPLMLGVLKKAEATPGMLEKEIVYKKMPGKVMYQQHFQGPTIEEGKSYSIHDLIFYCAAHSDNSATHALETNVDLSAVIKMFQEIGLPKPDMQNGNYMIGAKDFSSFMETIFNSTLLSPEYSEYAAEMLVNCSFKEGFSKGMSDIKPDVKLWHKFGEWNRPNSAEVELHESGTFFMNGKAYLLTVMTRGKDYEQLSTVLQKISGLVAKRLIKDPVSFARANVDFRSMGC